MAYTYSPHFPSDPARDPKFCAASVHETGRGIHIYQCRRKPVLVEDGHGWCKQHAPSSENAREAARHAKFRRQDDIMGWRHEHARLHRAIAEAALVGGDVAIAEACRAYRNHDARRPVGA